MIHKMFKSSEAMKEMLYIFEGLVKSRQIRFTVLPKDPVKKAFRESCD